MTTTVADVIIKARALVGDASADRAGTSTCEGYVRDALNIVLGRRPDLFLGQYATGVSASLASASAFPISTQFLLPVAAFVGALIESQDEQAADAARRELLVKLGGGLL